MTATTRQEWAEALAQRIQRDHIDPPQDPTELTRALLCWAVEESGTDPQHTPARFNPLNDERAQPGATDFNSVGVKNYTSLEQGAHAVFSTLSSPIYRDLWIACRHNDTDTIRAAISVSPWSGLPAKDYYIPKWSSTIEASGGLIVSGGPQGG